MSIYANKMVNGVSVALTAQEIADLEARDVAWVAGNPVRQAIIARFNGLETDQSVIDWSDRLANLTSAQVDAFFASNITSAAQAIALLKALIKIQAARS